MSILSIGFSPNRSRILAIGDGEEITITKIEDLKNWLKHESTKKFEESLKKLGLDNSKIQGKHLVAYSLDDL